MKTNLAARLSFIAAVLIVLGFLGSTARADDKSAATFKQKCATCHGPDGKAETPAAKALKVRSFASPETAKTTDDQLVGIIEKGQGKMPKYGASMKPDEVKALVAYIRTLAK